MSAAAIVSVEDHLRLTDKPYCEYIDGVLFPKAIPTTLHAFVQFTLIMLLRRQRVQALSEVTVRLTATRYLIPDVIAAPKLQSPYPTDPVFLCVEVLSRENRVGAMLAKCEQYHAWGVPFCWIVDPEKQTAWQYHSGDEPERVERGGTLTAGEITVQLNELFSEIPASH
ncbi:MAG: Uma2 family endonuclease [Bryobacterales bacterium]|nr:Uma2 family endonuclease [Bryobacterales bacterium]